MGPGSLNFVKLSVCAGLVTGALLDVVDRTIKLDVAGDCIYMTLKGKKKNQKHSLILK